MEHIIKQVEKRSGLMGLELEGLVKEAVWLNAGMVLQFHEPIKRGRKISAGQMVCIVCSTKIVETILEDYTNRVDLDNGLSIIY